MATRGGWFSDRSACYLASGKPVLAQDTGFGDGAADRGGPAGVRRPRAARRGGGGDAARGRAGTRGPRASIAEEFFASERVLADLLEALDSG